MFHRRKLLPLYIAATLASGQAAAVGLGDLSLHSYLGKPLQAEVALSHMGDLSVDQLKVQIGNEADYSALGVEYNYLHSRLHIEPFMKNGQTYVRITSSDPISEPYLNFVLNLRWPQGQVMREFTVLLDPAPIGGALANQADVSEPASAETPAVADPVDAVSPVSAPAVATAPKVARARPVAAPRPAAAGSYVTQRGDSLWRLAAKLRPSESVSVEQMMAALQSANPHAFIEGNAARLKEAVSIDVAAAEHIALQGGAAPNHDAVADTSAPATAVPTAAASTTDVSTVRQVPAPAAAPVQSSLAQENAALKAQVADLSNNVSSLNTSLAESTDRLRAMEARLDNVLREFQTQRAAQASTFEGQVPASVAMPGSVINQVNAAELRPAPKAHTPWWVHLLYWSGIGGAVAWAVREHFWPARRLALAGVDLDEDARRVVQPAAPAFREVPRTAPAAAQRNEWQAPEEGEELTLDLGDIMPMDDEPAPIELNLPRQPEDLVDASISAGVFVAFGRFDEAERLLQEALTKEPARDDLRLQLLDVYLQSDQPEAFEQLAQVIEASPASAETLAELAVLRDSYSSRG